MTDRSVAFKQGWLVRHTTEPLEALRNPYPAGTSKHDEWAAGCTHAAAQIEAKAKGADSEELSWDD